MHRCVHIQTLCVHNQTIFSGQLILALNTELSLVYLNVQVVVIPFSELDKHGEEREDRTSAEEGALRPDHSDGEEGQDHGQHTIKPLLQQTFPIPL